MDDDFFLDYPLPSCKEIPISLRFIGMAINH